MGSALFRWVVETGGSCISVWTEAAIVEVIFVGLILLLFLSIDRASPIWKLAASIGFIGLVKSVSMAVSSRLSTTAIGSVISTGYLRTELVFVIHIWNIAVSCRILIIDRLLATVRSSWVLCRIELVLICIIVVIGLIAIYRHIIDITYGVAGPSSLPLLSQLCLGNCFWNGWQVILIIRSRRVEKLSSHIHLLLGVCTSIGVSIIISISISICICILCFSLVYKVEKMGLVVRTWRICCSYSLISNSACICRKATSTISFTDLVLVMTLCGISIAILLPSVTLPQLGHEVTIEHGLSHLSILLSLSELIGLRRSSCNLVEASYSCLIEHLLLSELVYIRKHFVNSRVICWLKHDAGLSCVHFIDRKGSVASSIAASLFSHAISHEERLIWLLGTQPKQNWVKNRLLTFRWLSELVTGSKHLCNFDYFNE